ncbi:MAG: hypothetical protein CFE45_07495 [Burkholderiales bacterium PBB5]|nr:MAG: hypothetical protein CFE45_07495 [Burkholderiales bacterium PBB5]
MAPQPLPADTARPAASGGVGLAQRSSDVVVDGSPAQAVRQHFAQQRHDLGSASPMIMLLDPSRLWAAQVVHALSDAAAQPLQRLNLRERTTLRTLAVIERTVVPRRGSAPLRVYHADLRSAPGSHGLDPDAITCALAEGSQLTAVIVGTMQPQALQTLLQSLLAACRQPEWRCPALVFLVPPGADGLQQRILSQPWPPSLRVEVLAEPLGSASGVWNSVLAAWDHSRQQHALPAHSGPSPTTPAAAGADAAADPSTHPPGARRYPATAAAATPDLPWSAPLLARLLALLSRTDGLLACGVVDLHRGDLLASDARALPPAELALAARTLVAVQAAHAHAAAGGALDEVLLTCGHRQLLLRGLPGAPGLGLVAVVARAQANLPLLRFKLLDAEQLLATP